MHPLLRPRWLIAHVIVIAIAVTFVNLGFWQLGRYHDKRAYNAQLLARGAEPVLPVEELLSAPEDPAVEEVAYRRATAGGRYDTANELVLLSRARNGIAGHHVITPLVTDAGVALLVNRGWVPYRLDTPPVVEAPPPAGEVTVHGVLFPSQTRGRFGPQHEPGARLAQVFRIDIERLRAQFPYELYPQWLIMEEQTPAGAELPIPAPPPSLEEGPHLTYAGQWFLFTLVGLIGYPILARQRLRALRKGEGAASAAPSAEPEDATASSVPRPS